MNVVTNKTHRTSGFTLAEIMIAAAILALVSTGLATLMITSTRGLFWATNKASITSDVRNFTMRISQETLGARVGYVYDSFAIGDRNENDDRRQSSESGDCLVLIYYEPYPDIDDPLHYNKIIVFFRRPDADGLSPVYRAEKTFSTPKNIRELIEEHGDDDHFEKLLAAEFPSDSGDFPVVLELSRGLADGNLFRNFGNNTFVVNGEILHGNKIKEVTNTYNLTISPRG